MIRLAAYVSKGWGGLLWLGFLMACGPQTSDKAARTQALLAEAGLRDSARQALDSYLFLPEDVPAIHTYLSHSQPDDSLGESSSRGRLLRVLAELPDAETPPLIEDRFRSFTLAQQKLALQTLAQQGRALASETLVRLLSQDPALGNEILGQMLGPYFEQPEQIGPLFPALLDLRSQPGYGSFVFGLLRAGLEGNSLAPESLRDQVALLRTSYLKPLDEEAREHLLFVLSFYAEQPSVHQLLMQAIRRGETSTQLAASLACLDRGMALNDSVWKALAAQPLSRNSLYLALQERGESSRFPEPWRTQAAFAEGDLAGWLALRYPKAGAPELLARYQLANSGEFLYAFRFVYDGYWRSAISGPQPADSTKVRAAGYLTNTELERYFGHGLETQVSQILTAQSLDGFRLLPLQGASLTIP